MGQPKDLGEIWDLVRKSLDYRPGDLLYMAIYHSPTLTLTHGLYEVVKPSLLELDIKPLGCGPTGLVDTDELITVPIWAPLQKTGTH